MTYTPPKIDYPDSDGKPMADNTKQFGWIVTIKEGLDWLFRDRPDVFVAGDLLWYPVEGKNTIRVAPDALVAFGRPKGYRGSYMQWKENNIAPQVVFEVLSPGNTQRQMAHKLEFYERYGVEEYYLYDPDRGVLQGWIGGDGKLEAIDAMQGWVSPLLGIRFGLEGVDLQLVRPDGQPFESYGEVAARAEQERQRAEQERQRAEQERQRAERLAEQLKALGLDPDSLR
ncbi:Uma2 family endonuclease [Synechococcus sp. PCC 7336]|uniref:Uma2 family endonuclease n=1 Tax=Synechococcus sp. PCC 7336 TaxID=195250 RepID=UPI00193094BB|nr:Uma2 family endonuclease [Synechococcus sp. PCC 7336]